MTSAGSTKRDISHKQNENQSKLSNDFRALREIQRRSINNARERLVVSAKAYSSVLDVFIELE